MPNQHNQDQLKMLKEKLSRAKSFAIVNYDGTSAADQVKLRSALKDAGAEFVVAKNTLVGLAVENKEFAESLNGMNAIVLSYEDEISGFKQVVNFHEEEKKLEIKQGGMDDKVLSIEEVFELSKLPSKDQLIATLIARIQGPASGLVNVLKASQKSLVYVLKAISEKN
ncbi:MAG: 50S ribosomal protein L10 [Candidatus Pacebacteria bacterium]|jgi:large subunit ribosomal protein L10|nr:50S ribosomal protein L10 [Candidatus Paceibacterota bacterium]MBT3511789.1 50S ribosomal protein L10 [Candidatus Paceibacterota bacterium]MBT4005113.1 50S ribosomal protein L10 [Candidatus Paceibacterota bacterium]MBT4358885.1 50S ribosomal protein L10 [Candidatus Paceibacterota bacterium]MBT4681221.1 50S ribosomal protein L10 [Candidatus Paceibacterota bacterium]